jgi:dephospho-CoA kinase
MKKILLGLVGETGSGKDTFCQYIQKTVEKPVFCFRFSEPLSETLRIFAGEVRKEDQQWLGTVLRQRFGQDVLAQAIARKIRDINKGLIILNGIRCWEEFGMIKDLRGKIFYITADSKKRWERVRKRGDRRDDFSSFRKFLEREKAKTEILIPKIGQKADFAIKNNGSLKAFYLEINEIIKKLKLK